MACEQKMQSLVEEDIQGLPPLSPVSQSFNSQILTLTSIVVMEFEVSFNKPQMVELLRDVLVPTNDRFSSVIVKDKKGVQRWKRIEPMIENHVIVPTFPSGLSLEAYDTHFNNYLSKVAMDRLPENRPPWEVHVFMYPTSNGAGILIFKLSHALGDGYSFMGTLLSSCKRVDDPSLPVSFPSSSSKLRGRISNWSRVSSLVSRCLNTVSDSAWSLLQGMFLEDGKTAIRSGVSHVELQPLEISSVTFALDPIRQVKSKVGGTVNDVVVGIISYAIQLYMQRMSPVCSGKRITALIILNMRMLRGFQSTEDMLKANIWGNHCSFLNISLPSFSNAENLDPLKFIVQAKRQMRRKRNSAAIYFTGKLLSMLKTIFGPEVANRFIYSTIKNASVGISNLIGPMQKVAFADHPLNGLYFTVVGAPQSLFFAIVTYVGKLRLVVRTEKGFINTNVLVSCLKDANEKIFIAALGEDLI